MIKGPLLAHAAIGSPSAGSESSRRMHDSSSMAAFASDYAKVPDPARLRDCGLVSGHGDCTACSRSILSLLTRVREVPAN